jgi:hypothetical protein
MMGISKYVSAAGERGEPEQTGPIHAVTSSVKIPWGHQVREAIYYLLLVESPQDPISGIWQLVAAFCSMASPISEIKHQNHYHF